MTLTEVSAIPRMAYLTDGERLVQVLARTKSHGLRVENVAEPWVEFFIAPDEIDRWRIVQPERSDGS